MSMDLCLILLVEFYALESKWKFSLEIGSFFTMPRCDSDKYKNVYFSWIFSAFENESF